MSSDNAVKLAVIMERKALLSKWAEYRWEAIGVVPDDARLTEPCKIFENAERLQWLYPGLELRLYGDEADNYLLNVDAPEPRVFVMWRKTEEIGEDGDLARPERVTVSYGEAARMMDAGEEVDGVPLPADLLGWIEDFARSHYRPPEKKSGRFASSKQGKK